MTPIIVSILRCNKTGGCQWPDFDLVPADVRHGGLHWTKYIDAYGIGWHYDQESPLGQADETNPDRNVWFAGTLIPDEFAREASARFPDRVRIVSEDEWRDFYEYRVAANEPDEIADNSVLQTIVLKAQLEALGQMPAPSLAEIDKRNRALDPDNPSPGLKKNPKKLWKTAKKRFGL